MKTIHERIRYAREQAGLTQPQLAEKVGVSPQAVQQWEKVEGGTSPRGSRLEALSKAVNRSVVWIQFGDVPQEGSGVVASLRPVAVWEHEHDLNQDEYVFLPALEVKLSAGDGAAVWHVDEKGQRQAFTRKWATRHCIDPECAATYVVSGSSMEPRLLDGDSIVIDYCRNDVIIDGKVYAIALNGEVFVKRLFKEIGGGVRVVSDNPDKVRYPDRVISTDLMSHLQIIGMAVAVSGGL